MSPRAIPSGYAGATDVPVDRSKAQIDLLLQRHGADGFHAGWQGPQDDDPGWDAIEFMWKGKVIRFKLARPGMNDVRVRAYSGRTPQVFIEQINRQRWRILYLVIKAKLEAVEAGVVVFEEEFLPFIVMPNGKTVGEVLVPRIQAGTQLQLEGGR